MEGSLDTNACSPCGPSSAFVKIHAGVTGLDQIQKYAASKWLLINVLISTHGTLLSSGVSTLGSIFYMQISMHEVLYFTCGCPRMDSYLLTRGISRSGDLFITRGVSSRGTLYFICGVSTHMIL